jgi:hypothetical protein
MTIVLLLLVGIAFFCAGFELWRSKGGSLEAWAVFLLALVALVERLW